MPFELGRGQKSRRRMRWRARSNMNRAAARLAEMPREGKDDRRKVWRSMDRSPAIRRQRLKGRSQASKAMAVRRTTPKEIAGAVYSPSTNDETRIAIAK